MARINPFPGHSNGNDALRRWSRRLQGLPPPIGSGPSMLNMSTPYLPVEVKGVVAEHLTKLDLKTLRLVSKLWCAVATPLLFDKIYISTRSKDIDVFKKITRHPILRMSVKDMVYDVSNVCEMSRQYYFRALWKELRYIIRCLGTDRTFNGPDSRLNQFYNEIQRTKYYLAMFFEYGNDKIVIEGFQRWRELVAEEHQCFGDTSNMTFVSDLCSGLYRLPNLRSVNMYDGIWGQNCLELGRTIERASSDTSLRDIFLPTGSPLARSWNSLHLRPFRPDVANVQFHDHLVRVMRAFSKAERTIKHFKCGSFWDDGICPGAFFYEMTDSFPRDMTDTLSQLESLSLGITPQIQDVLDHRGLDTIGFLPHLLNRMICLKSLRLNLLTTERMTRTQSLSSIPLDDACYTYSQIFPQRGKWPRLEHLMIRGLAIDGLDLVYLLYAQMPQLTHLWLYRIDLLDCRWEGAIEAMRYLPVCWEVLGLQGQFRHCNG
ncbi:hypothetical protein MMC28_004214 [Mycoblastus sanguinarius]|nr:hypothetical protein [Mycoblastus sanguinarius]